MDIPVRYWDEEKHLVVTKYLRSLTFCRATVVDTTKMFTDLQDNKSMTFLEQGCSISQPMDQILIKPFGEI